MKTGAAPLKQFPWVETSLLDASHYYLLGLLAAGVLSITEDRTDLMKNIHQELRVATHRLSQIEQQVLEKISSRFERLVWMLRYLTKTTHKIHGLS